MTRAKISQYSATANDNTDVNGVNIAEGCPPSSMNNMGREIMAALKRFQVGSDGDGVTVGGSLVVSGSTTTNTFSATQITASGPVITSAGTAAAPAIVPTGDTNTGIFFPAADTIAFAEGGVEAMRINSSSQVLVGTTTARSDFSGQTAVLQVEGTSVGTSSVAITRNENNAFGPILYLSKSRGGLDGHTIVQSGDTIGEIIFQGADGVDDSGALVRAATIEVAVDGTPGSNDMPGRLMFYTTADGSTSPTERMRITSSGNVGIGTSSPNLGGVNKAITLNSAASTNASYELSINGTFIGSMYTNTADSSMRFGTWQNAPMVFLTNSTERARITSGGYFKASNNGSYANSTAAYHEIYQSAADRTLYLTGASASLTADGIVIIDAARNTTNNTFYALSYYNTGAGNWKFRVADSGNVTNTNNSYGSLSDVKLKQDIVDAGSQWDDIKSLRVRKYRWKSDPDGFMQMGLVAQEAEEVSPGLVEEHPDYEEVTKTREVEKTRFVTEAVLDEDGNEIEPAVTETYTEEEEYTEREPTGTVTKAVKYSILYMKAVKALQEAMERIETLEAKVAALEAK